jgi:hypothetical protein
MKFYIRSGATALALLAGVAIAMAQAPSPNAPAGSAPASKSQTMPGSPSTQSSPNSMNQSGALQLSAAQKTAIFKSVTKEKVKSPPPANLSLAVGGQVPATVELYPLPANIVSSVPATKQFKYTVAQNQVVLVDPANMKIVEIIKQ